MRYLIICGLAAALSTITVAPACAQGDEDSDVGTTTTVIETEAGSPFAVESTEGVDERFLPIVERLVADGWDRSFVLQRFRDKRSVFIPKMVKVNRPKGKSSTNWKAYAWVNTESSADACRSFINQYSKELTEAEEKYGVDQETIAALLRCETRHGKVTGDYHVFSVYASMSLMTEPDYIAANQERAREELKAIKASKSKVRSDLAYIEKRSNKRGGWAYKELKNLLRIDKEGKLDAMTLYGSWAGAFGWSQFLPSSYLRAAVDGNGDGAIDLFDPADAIHSVANYLKNAGYRSGSSSRIKKALRSYNPSTPYVESIAALAVRVKKSQN